jgi:hypothetical protein
VGSPFADTLFVQEIRQRIVFFPLLLSPPKKSPF